MKLKIYYVDDEPELCEMFEDLFSENDITIKTFCNPIKALEEIKQSAPHLLFTDYRMPGLNGEELANHTPLEIKKFLITGENTITTEYHFDEILTKPIDIDRIREIIETNKKLI